ncbi:MAG: DUF2116 family Zn-ribbon domain-containing protein [Nanoarchaeota archaeon]|nr:DUF2116 family Zn-ribbon domain-containing protein [Nanoarchaeota archaeon]
MKPTGWCWNCGKPCSNLFCNEKCEKSFERKQRPKVRKKYGITGYIYD